MLKDKKANLSAPGNGLCADVVACHGQIDSLPSLGHTPQGSPGKLALDIQLLSTCDCRAVWSP